MPTQCLDKIKKHSLIRSYIYIYMRLTSAKEICLKMDERRPHDYNLVHIQRYVLFNLREWCLDSEIDLI